MPTPPIVIDCLGSGGCLTYGIEECNLVPCNAAKGPVLSFMPADADPAALAAAEAFAGSLEPATEDDPYGPDV